MTRNILFAFLVFKSNLLPFLFLIISIVQDFKYIRRYQFWLCLSINFKVINDEEFLPQPVILTNQALTDNLQIRIDLRNKLLALCLPKFEYMPGLTLQRITDRIES